ncbi:hypothetical protein G3495_12935 [Shewanella baltica]|uniref:hypothetical protein n=1 Tax=Shewanella baltica TaxID=62322 RepID=UPI00217E884B|nr:hypothetical protein [Shewanella baltica]MCS6236021.1 hypothetical protein [Shewanella baltica]MCS6272157.1 hypothetical protein [Shewanella baltica]
MKIVQSFNNASHGGLVFFDANSANQRNLSNAIGRYDHYSDELMLLNDESAIVRKMSALLNAGAFMNLVPIGSNYFCSFDKQPVSEAVIMSLVNSPSPVSEAVVSTDLPTTIESPTPRKVIYRDQCVGVMENDDFYLDEEFESAEDHEFEFYDEGDDSDIYIDPDFKSGGLDILSTIMDRRLANKIKDQKAVVESFFASTDEESIIEKNRQKQRDKMIADTLSFMRN